MEILPCKLGLEGLLKHAVRLTKKGRFEVDQASMAETTAKVIVRLVKVGDMDGAKKILARIHNKSFKQLVKNVVAKALKQ